MVLNRLRDPYSKLGVPRRLETVALPEVDVTAITHQPLSRSMDALMDQQAKGEQWAGKLLLVSNQGAGHDPQGIVSTPCKARSWMHSG